MLHAGAQEALNLSHCALDKDSLGPVAGALSGGANASLASLELSNNPSIGDEGRKQRGVGDEG